MRKTALITGASRGIGRAIAMALAKDGNNIAVNYNRNKEIAIELCDEIQQKYGVMALAVQGDVSTPQGASELVNAVKINFGKIDILVNNAGISSQKLFTEMSVEEWNTMINTNLNSLFYVSKCVVPIMLQYHSGIIVNIGSMWGSVGAATEVHYSTAKSGIVGFTKSLAKELAPSNIRVNMVSPGVIDTDMMSIFSKDTKEDLVKEIPLNRLGNPEDVAKVVAFLCSHEGEYITGENINISGGFII